MRIRSFYIPYTFMWRFTFSATRKHACCFSIYSQNKMSNLMIYADKAIDSLPSLSAKNLGLLPVSVNYLGFRSLCFCRCGYAFARPECMESFIKLH